MPWRVLFKQPLTVVGFGQGNRPSSKKAPKISTDDITMKRLMGSSYITNKSPGIDGTPSDIWQRRKLNGKRKIVIVCLMNKFYLIIKPLNFINHHEMNPEEIFIPHPFQKPRLIPKKFSSKLAQKFHFFLYSSLLCYLDSTQSTQLLDSAKAFNSISKFLVSLICHLTFLRYFLDQRIVEEVFVPIVSMELIFLGKQIAALSVILVLLGWKRSAEDHDFYRTFPPIFPTLLAGKYLEK